MERPRLGLPAEWREVQRWLGDDPTAVTEGQITSEAVRKKMPELEVLPDYRKRAPGRFWKNFPKFRPTGFVAGPVQIDRLEQLTRQCWGKWDQQQKKDA